MDDFSQKLLTQMDPRQQQNNGCLDLRSEPDDDRRDQWSRWRCLDLRSEQDMLAPVGVHVRGDMASPPAVPSAQENIEIVGWGPLSCWAAPPQVEYL